MKISGTCILTDAALINMFEEERLIAFIVFGRDEAERVLVQHAEGNEYLHIVREDLDRVNFPAVATQATLTVEGTAVTTLNSMSSHAADLTEGRMTAMVGANHAMLYSLFLSNNPTVQDGLLGFSDDKDQHHIVVIYSKQQGRRIVPKTLAKQKTSRSSPETTECLWPA